MDAHNPKSLQLFISRRVMNTRDLNISAVIRQSNKINLCWLRHNDATAALPLHNIII